MRMKSLHANLDLSLYNTIVEEYTVGPYYWNRKLTAKFTRGTPSSYTMPAHSSRMRYLHMLYSDDVLYTA